MKFEIFESDWTPNDVRSNKDKVFVFGDNNMRIGKGGQAIIRDLPNTIGIRTKKGPSNKPIAFYTDSEFMQNVENIREDILDIKSSIIDGKTVVFSSGGYGTGLGKLKLLAPKTFHFLCGMLRYHFDFDNETGRRWVKIPGHDEIVSGKYISLDKENKNIIQPVNNSYFLEEYLLQNLNSTYDLIKSQKKFAFTSKTQYKTGEILLFTSPGKSHLVCRVSDSYESKLSLNKGLWHKFEGFTKKFNFKSENTFQTHFRYICNLDDKGNITYIDGIISNTVPVKTEKPKVVGDKVVTEKTPVKVKIENLESIIKLLKNNSIEGEVTQISKDGNKQKLQVKVEDIYYAVEYKKILFWDSISILLTSKNPFI